MKLVQPPPIHTPHTEAKDSRESPRMFSRPWSDWFSKVVTPKLETSPQFQEGTHKDRIGSQAPIWPLGSIYHETDRTVFYVAAGSPERWKYAFGTMFGLDAGKPSDLGANDAGFQYYSTDTAAFHLWNGSAWVAA